MSTRTEKKISTKVSNTIQKKDNGDVKKKTRKRVVVSYEKSDPPVGWETTYKLIKQQRERVKAPVDEMGCSQLAEKEISPKLKRYQTLISLMLSSQTRDEMTARAMGNLREYGLTPQKIIDMEESKLKELIKMVGFYSRKAQYIKETTQTLIDNYDGDIPDTVEELCQLKGIGPKMAVLTLNCVSETPVGIGVDVHVHRITNRLGWVDSKNPEGTRKQLESWLPKDKWDEINFMLVGFGQTICKSTPKCDTCDASALCPSSNIKKKKTKKNSE